MKKVLQNIAVLSSLLGAAMAHGQSADPLAAQSTSPLAAMSLHAHPELIAAATAVKPGQAIDVAVRFAIDPGWHMYWLNPGDSGLPPRVEWKLPAGVTAGPLQFLTPRRIDTGYGMTSFGYEGECVLLTRLHVPADFSGKAIPVEANLNWLVCREKCLMENATARTSVPVGQGQPAAADRFAAWHERVPQPDKNVDLVVATDAAAHTGRLELRLPAGCAFQDFFPPPMDAVEFSKPQPAKALGGPAATVEFRILAGEHPKQAGDGIVVYTDGDAQTHRASVPVAIP